MLCYATLFRYFTVSCAIGPLFVNGCSEEALASPRTHCVYSCGILLLLHGLKMLLPCLAIPGMFFHFFSGGMELGSQVDPRGGSASGERKPGFSCELPEWDS
ncbi:unnamed protein product [Ostreobium quekettii]|uniref:Uncharacterized protein n=1 Tax=Ostreobium quekettii TaxID=121088 RepID=A0A8S1IVW2_9CHLO|nr:unnamed protein product [Ostreobium quekettii]